MVVYYYFVAANEFEFRTTETKKSNKKFHKKIPILLMKSVTQTHTRTLTSIEQKPNEMKRNKSKTASKRLLSKTSNVFGHKF